MKILTRVWINLTVMLLPIQSAFAQSDVPILPSPNDNGNGSDTTLPTPDTIEISIPNPLKADSVEKVVSSIGNYLIGISAAVLTVMVLWGAFQFMTSGGNEERVSKGKKTIYWAVLGFIVLLIAGGLASLVADILGGADVDTGDTGIEGISISGFGGVKGVILTIAKWMFGILMSMGIIMTLYSAFLYMFSGGNSEKIGGARRTLTYAIVALAIGVVSGGVAVLIRNLLDSATGG